MLGKQRRNNKIDQQFMDAAWKNMAEILDQEMPVERKERRIGGWISIAALLVMGFVGGISVMWGLQKHESGPMASNHEMSTTSEANLASTHIVDENKVMANPSQQKETQILTSNTSAYNSKTTLNNITPKKSNIRTAKAEQVPTMTAEVETVLASVDLPEKSIVEDIPAIVASTEISLTHSPIVSAGAMTLEVIEERDNTNPVIALSELPTLGLTALPTVNTSFGIDNDIDLPKNKKWRTGIYGGAIVAGKTGNGLEAAFRIERKLGAKWAVETGLGFRATQLAFLSANQSPNDLELEDALSPPNSFVNEDGDTIVGSSIAATQEIANRVNADEPNYQLTLPLSFVYRPTGKLRLALGMSWAYRLNKLKDASSFDNSIPRTEFIGDNNLDQNTFSNRLNDIRLNFGVGYHLNPRTAIEIAFSEGLSGSSNTTADALSNNLSTKSEEDLPSRFLQVGLTHYFGK